jgi:uncharacterized protein
MMQGDDLEQRARLAAAKGSGVASLHLEIAEEPDPQVLHEEILLGFRRFSYPSGVRGQRGGTTLVRPTWQSLPWAKIRGEEDLVEEPTQEMVLEDLTLTECLALLSSHQVGRVAVVADGQPVILPVNYRTDEGTVVFRTDEGTKTRGAPLSHVAFEIDEIDQASHAGWSVVVQGVGLDISDAIDARSEQLRVLPVSPWAPGGKSYWIKIVPNVISGRTLRRRQPTDAAE